MIVKLAELMEQENNLEVLEKICKKSHNRTFKENLRKIVWENNARIFINYVMNNILFNTISYRVDDTNYTFLCGEVVSSREEFELAFGEFLYEFEIDKSLIDNRLAAIDYLVNDTINHMMEYNSLYLFSWLNFPLFI